MAFTNELALSFVKARMNILAANTAMDDYLNSRIDAAAAELQRLGITLDDGNADDLMLCVDYTVWQYQNRDSGNAMPEWLRLRRRERWIAQHAVEREDI